MTAPLTIGTAGHVDHGKTALVKALTGVDTDRLPEEQKRGITIVPGYAAVPLPRGQRLSLVDVPGHERLIGAMVSGVSGIDLYLLVIAADDGVMPQTIEHVRVLGALGVTRGVVAVTKADLAAPGPASAAAARLVPDAEVVACSARTGAGLPELMQALTRVADGTPTRATRPGPTVLHIDRVFTIPGAGTVVTGTLWSGRIARGDRLTLLPAGTAVRVREVQVHDRAVPLAEAGQRVAVNLASLRRAEVRRGDALMTPAAPLTVAYRIEAELALQVPLDDRARVRVHHGTRDVAARVVRLGPDRWQLRCERPLIAMPGDRLVVRRSGPPDTLGGGVILSVGGTGREASRARSPVARPPRLTSDTLALEARLRAAGHEPPTRAELGDDARELPALIAAGRAVRIGRAMYAHPDAIARVRSTLTRIAMAEGSITLARLRDELGTSRRYALALLQHFDAVRLTRRDDADRRVLRRAHGDRP